ncbi:MAG TPA: DUF983 domain-containing protein [Rhizomicrobium sp.]|jgi:uncharacterized protein (DUF983 family)
MNTNATTRVTTTPSLKLDLLKGFVGRCPHCGKGHLFRAFLKVADRCSACGEEFFHHQADDFPAYLVIVVVDHVIAAALLTVEAWRLFSAATEAAIFIPLTLVFSLALLQPMKGAVVALQWHLGMHGFQAARLARETGA